MAKKPSGSPQDDLHKRMQALRAALANDPEQAKELLQRAGILTKSGNVAKPYRPLKLGIQQRDAVEAC